MNCMRRLILVVAVLTAALAGPSAAEAKTIGAYHQVRAYVMPRIAQQIGFVPISGIGGRETVVSITDGEYTYKGPWANVTSTMLTLTQALKSLYKYGDAQGTYTDRELTAAERRRFDILATVGYDADVLAVKEGHPACAGVTLAQARAIAAGKVRSWAEVVPGASGSIALRATIGDSYEARFGVARKPAAAKGQRDGGLADAAKDESVVAVTSWSRARSRGGVCVVPVGGVSPSNATVRALTYPTSFPVMFVAPKNRDRGKLPRTELQLYVKFLKSAKAAKLFSGNGLVTRADSGQPSPTGGPTGGPSRDAQGRSVNTVRDDAGVTAALAGDRIAPQSGGYYWAFESGGVLRYIENSGTCSQSEGRWTVVEGYRYSENGGGVIARVSFDIDGTANVVTLDVPNEPAGTAYMQGTPYSRSRDLPGSC